MAYEDSCCAQCGGWLPETTAKENDGKYLAEHPQRCHRCEALRVRRAQHTSERDQSYSVWPVGLKVQD